MHDNIRLRQRRCRSKGFTLVEVLVSVAIMSFGLLGLAALQVNSMKKNMDAYLKSSAAILANDLAEKMRANLSAVDSGGYEKSVANLSVNSQCFQGVSSSFESAQQGSSTCTKDEIAINDLIEWQDNITNLLPGALGQVCKTSTPGTDPMALNCDNIGNLYVISISWVDRKNNRKMYRLGFNP